ncbi:MAG: hypothetical protein VX466_10620, partial [Myxococcota bacterium]|nr:hypothetical protein [Myxococcota bacterium]
SVEQRCVLGFPEPGHAYWTRGTLDGVRARLEPWGMEIAPYEEAWAQRQSAPSGCDGAAALDQLRDENARLREELSLLRARSDAR